MRRLLAWIGRVDATTRIEPRYLISGTIHTVTDMRTGETVRILYTLTERDARGRIRTSKVLT